jgi:putative hydrolase of the HAD superfamily
MKDIKQIIFDLGGVILNIDYHLTIKAFIDLGVEDFDGIYCQAKQINLFDDLDKGLIKPQQFRDELRKLTGIPLSDDDIDKAWNAILLDFPEENIALLQDAKKHYRTFILSNTNEIHFPVYTKMLQQKFGINELSDLFEKEYYSHKLGLRKPDKKIFELVLSENNLNPAETLFIDDSEQNTEAASALGIQTYLIKPGEKLTSLFLDGILIFH